MKSHHPQIKIFPVEIVERGLELVQTAHRLHLNNQVKAFHKKLRANYKRRYFASAVELWARGYTQFVIRRCIKAGIKMNNRPVLPYQWADEDFKPIYDEILAIFSAKGWLRKKA